MFVPPSARGLPVRTWLREGKSRFGTQLTKQIQVLRAPTEEQRTLRLMGDRFRVQVS